MRQAKQTLLKWYAENHRALPWRANRDPYRIWISETMLQQTTTTAVIPFFERFTERFPDLKSLATAKVEAVLEAWAGLGYYSRARNLHKSAQALHQAGGFPKTFRKLIEFPGFGPYTSRSVASLAFGEAVGVVDGNVIRVLSRYHKKDWNWWQTKTRDEIQILADEWVEDVSSYQMNQALMELGRTICMPKATHCLLCPLRESCKSLKDGDMLARPKPKPKREREIWVWEPAVQLRGGKLLIEKVEGVPFLRGHWALPGKARQVKVKPKKFDYKHTVTHHDIYVMLKEGTRPENESKWITLKELRQYAPTSLVQKALESWNSRSDRGRGVVLEGEKKK
jgi:A/G-specific adenine glycosylase